MSHSVKVAEFMSYCIEMYASSKHLSGSVVAARLAQSGGLDYIRRGYEVLHTMGREWIIEDLDDYLKSRGVAA